MNFFVEKFVGIKKTLYICTRKTDRGVAMGG